LYALPHHHTGLASPHTLLGLHTLLPSTQYTALKSGAGKHLQLATSDKREGVIGGTSSLIPEFSRGFTVRVQLPDESLPP
jgi:hypothetical protein